MARFEDNHKVLSYKLFTSRTVESIAMDPDHGTQAPTPAYNFSVCDIKSYPVYKY